MAPDNPDWELYRVVSVVLMIRSSGSPQYYSQHDEQDDDDQNKDHGDHIGLGQNYN